MGLFAGCVRSTQRSSSMYFSSIPEAFAPIGAPLRYTLTGATANVLDLRIYTADGQLLGTKRFLGQNTITCDIAPYLRAVLHLHPQPAHTGFIDSSDRSLTVYVEAVADTEQLRSDLRTFLPSAQPTITPSLLTALPTERLLAPSECDFLTLRLEQPIQIVVTAIDPAGRRTEHRYPTPDTGCVVFAVAADDFPTAEQLTLDLGPCGTLHYALLPRPEGAVRLAWLSRSGAIEHYTFPLVQRVERVVNRQRSYSREGWQGHVEQSEERLTLHSAYECEVMMRALGDLLSAEQLWMATAAGYHPVDLLTERAEMHRHGTLRMLAIEIRSTLKNDLLWS